MIILLVLFVPYIIIILLLAVSPALVAEPGLFFNPSAAAETAAYRLPYEGSAFIYHADGLSSKPYGCNLLVVYYYHRLFLRKHIVGIGFLCFQSVISCFRHTHELRDSG